MSVKSSGELAAELLPTVGTVRAVARVNAGPLHRIWGLRLNGCSLRAARPG